MIPIASGYYINMLKAEPSDVCVGIMARGGPSTYHSLKNMKLGSHTAKKFCANLFQYCEPEALPYDLSFPSPKPPTSRPPPSGQPPIEVVHFSDTHVDLSYETGSNWNCSKPICCRSYTKEDAPGNTSHPAGPWGNTKCDPPQRFHEDMLDAIADMNPAFSIYTGDVAAHDYWLVDKAEVLQNFNHTYEPIEKTLGIVYSALGNHDSAPAFQFPSDDINVPSQYNPQWAYEAVAKDWFALTGIISVKSAREHGSYSAIHPNSNSKLRIISYNSILYYKNNFWAYTEPIEFDPDDQLHWLINELQEAEDENQRVWLISHVPTGNSDHFRDHSHYLDRIIQRYEATIAALFFGHTHKDEFQVSYSASNFKDRNWDTATAMGYIAPSLTPTSGSPSFRVYQIDPVTYGVMDYTQYIANISDPSYQTKPKWTPYYSAKENYGSKLSPPVTADDTSVELTPAFWHNVTAVMEKDPSAFQDYWNKRTRGFDVSTCVGSCASNEICGLRGADTSNSCYQAPHDPGAMFSKRDGAGPVSLSSESFQEPECDHSEAASLFAKMAHRVRLMKKNGK